MVKKNLVNKNVVRALSIGLSLAMASQPLTAMAAEPADDAPVREPISEAPAVETQSEAEVAEAKAAEVKEDVDTDTANVNDVVDLTKDAISKAEALDVDASAANTDVQTLESGKKAAGVQEELQKITSETTGETTLKGLAQGVATAEANVTKPVEDAEKAVFGDKEEEVESLSEKIENADTAIKDASGKIAGATTPGAANSAYNEAATAVNDADTAVKAAEEKVETAQKELEVKEDEYDSLAEQYEAALKAYNDKVDALNLAKENALKKLGLPATREGEKVVGLTDELAELFAEDDQEVAIAASSLEVLKNKLDEAEKTYKKSGYGYIAALENAIEKYGASYGSNNNYSKLGDANIEKVEAGTTKATYRNLFKAIVENYYVPDILGGKFVKVEAEKLDSAKYYYDGDTTDINNESTNADVLRVFVVTYKELDENGNVKKDENGKDVEKKIKLNYKTANENKEGGYKGIVIFEKTEHTVLEGHDIDNGIEITANNGTNVKFGDTTKLTLFRNGKIYFQNADGTYTVLTQNGEKTTGTPVVDSAKIDGTKLTLAIDEEKKETDVLENTEKVSYEYVDGRIVKTVTNDITTTRYSGCSLYAQEEYDYKESLEAAKKDYLNMLRGQLTGISDNMSIIINGMELTNNTVIPDDADADDYGFQVAYGSKQGTEVTGYDVEVTYSSTFEKTVHISGRKKCGSIRDWWNRGINSEKNSDVDAANKGIDWTKNTLISFQDNAPIHYNWQPWEYDSYDGNLVYTYRANENGKKTEKVDVSATVTDENSAKIAAQTAVTNAASKTAPLIETRTVVGSRITKTYSQPKTIITYGYAAVNYVFKEVTTAKAQVTYTESWAVDEETSHVEYRNDNWYSGNVISISVDENNALVADYLTDGKGHGGDKTATVQDTAKSVALINKINEAKTKINEYETAKAAVTAAEQKVKEAEGEVETLKGLIEQISFSKKDNILAGLRSRLETAETELATAKAARDQLLENLRTLDGQRAQRIAALTSAPSGEGGGETGGEGGATTPGATGLLPGTAAPLAAGPAMFVAAPGGAGAPAAAVAEDNTVTLTEQRAALSDAVPEAQTEQATENIGDGKTALAAAPVSEETLSWWWLLIIAVLGGAGYAMYRKFHNKKDEKTTN